jgi:Protein of unknown function (DUF4240)
MNEDQFWDLIAAAKREAKGDGEKQLELLEAKLKAIAPEEIMDFQRIFSRFHALSYRTDLWGAAYIMNGGASDDGFDYFRGWLISQGKDVFEAALLNPDSLVNAAPDGEESDFGYENEDILNLAYRAWRTVTGQEEHDGYEAEPHHLPALSAFAWSDGQGDIDERKGKKLYPKLWKKFEMG